MSGLWAALPVKRFADAKQRLSSLLSQAERQSLAAAMLVDVLSALAAAPLDGIMINTPDPLAAALARRFGARVVQIRSEDGHTAAVAAMAETLAAEGVAAMLVLPGDIPRITAAEIGQLCAARRPAPSFTIAPAHDERGSNAVLLAPPNAVKLRFGDDSFFPHLDAARRQGIEPVAVALPGIGLDIDQPDDLRALLGATPVQDTHTTRLLRDFGLIGR